MAPSSRLAARVPRAARVPLAARVLPAAPTRHTFGALFGRDMLDPDGRGHYRQMVGDLIVSYLTG